MTSFCHVSLFYQIFFSWYSLIGQPIDVHQSNYTMNQTEISEAVSKFIEYIGGEKEKTFAQNMFNIGFIYGLGTFILILVSPYGRIFCKKIIEYFKSVTQESTPKKIQRVLVINHYTQEFSDEDLLEDLKINSFGKDDDVQIQRVFSTEKNGIQASVERRGREFEFKKEYWDRYALCGEQLKKKSPNAIVSLCPSTMMFYIGYAFNIREPEHFIVTSYFTPKKQFTNIQTVPVEYKMVITFLFFKLK